MQDKIDKIEEIICKYGQIDGSHHKAWVIDQVLRIIKDDDYDDFVKDFEYSDCEGKSTEEQQYEWDVRVAP